MNDGIRILLVEDSITDAEMIERELLRDDLRAHDLSAWRIGAFGGAPMAPATIAALAEQLPALVLMNAYGATETTSPATLMPTEFSGAGGAHHASVGRVVACGELLVMDPTGREVASGESGEVWIKGPMIATDRKSVV